MVFLAKHAQRAWPSRRENEIAHGPLLPNRQTRIAQAPDRLVHVGANRADKEDAQAR